MLEILRSGKKKKVPRHVRTRQKRQLSFSFRVFRSRDVNLERAT
jgi:hypothetical protein